MAWLGGVRVVLVTDRRRMGDGSVAAFGDAVARAVAALPPGTALVQVREKDLDGGRLLQLVHAAMASGAPVMVNDRLDVALAAGAAGVHLPGHGLSVAEARRLAPEGFWIGQSRHALAGFVDGGRIDDMIAECLHRIVHDDPKDVRMWLRIGELAQHADLVQLGPIFETPGKGPASGTDALRAARRRLETREARRRAFDNQPPGHVHLVAVGGISDAARAAECRAAGADAVAAIRTAWSDDVATLA